MPSLAAYLVEGAALFYCPRGLVHPGSTVAARPKISGGEGHGGRPAEDALLMMMSDGYESILLKIIEMVLPAFGRQSRFGVH
jgi:hypothetical protein